MSDKRFNTVRATVCDVAIADIDVSRNHRIAQAGDEARIKSLMESIAASGQLQPVRVYERGPDQVVKGGKQPRFILGFGARRVEAMKRLGHKTVQAMVFPPASDAEIESARAIENLHRQDIGPMEEVLAVAHLLDACQQPAYLAAHADARADVYGHIASRLGRSVSWVKDRNYLHRLHPAVRELAIRTQLPAGHLRAIAKIGDPEDQLKLAAGANGFGWWMIDTEASIKANRVVFEEVSNPNEFAKQWLEDFEARCAEGSFKRWTLKELEDAVQRRTRPLKTVPWDLALPVVVPASKRKKARKLPACAGCPHNSATDAELFGEALGADDKGRGHCANAGCYELKKAESEAVKKVLAKLATRKTKPDADVIDAKTPDWFRRSTAAGFVSREWEKKHPSKRGTKPASQNGASTSQHGKRPLTAHEVAIDKFSEALDKWGEAIAPKLERAVREGDAAIYCALAALCLADFGEPEEHGWDVPFLLRGSVAETESPKRRSNKVLAGFLARIKDGDREGVLQYVARLTPERHGSYRTVHDLLCGTPHYADFVYVLAHALGLEPDPVPEWRHFAPGSEKQPDPESKRSKKGKKPAKAGAA